MIESFANCLLFAGLADVALCLAARWIAGRT